MNRQQRHDLGYWMSIIGFAFVVTGGLFGSIMSADTGHILAVVAAGFLMFLVGGEMALRNMKHES